MNRGFCYKILLHENKKPTLGRVGSNHKLLNTNYLWSRKESNLYLNFRKLQLLIRFITKRISMRKVYY